MKNSCILILLMIFLFSCSNQQNSQDDADSKTSGIRKHAAEIAVDYIKSQLEDSTKTTSGGGVIWINDMKRMYEIDPDRILYGLVDADSTEDALVTLTSFIGQEPGIPEHLFLINNNGKLMLAKAIEMDMEILSLKDRVLTGKIHTKPRTSPLYDCPECIAIVKYKFENGDTVRIK